MSYEATLEDLAAKRRALEEVIVALAGVAGLDPAPFLSGALDDQVRDLVKRQRKSMDAAALPNTHKDRQAVPQARPTEGAAKRPAGNQLLDAKVMSILKSGPQGMKAIATHAKVSTFVLKPSLARLELGKAITKSGTGRGLLFQLKSTT